MKKAAFLIFTVLFVMCSVSAEEKNKSFAGVSVGHSWFHNYSGMSKHGMNIALNYEPALDRYVSIDFCAALHFYRNMINENEKLIILIPQVSIGPRFYLPLFNDRFYIFTGTGLSFNAGIDYMQGTGEATADFTPGIYLKAGLNATIGKVFALGISSKYNWNIVHLPHLLSFNIHITLFY